MYVSIGNADSVNRCLDLANLLDIASYVESDVQKTFVDAINSDELDDETKRRCAYLLQRIPEVFAPKPLNFDFGIMLSDSGADDEDIRFLFRMLNTKTGRKAWKAVLPAIHNFLTAYLSRRYDELNSTPMEDSAQI